MTDNEILKALKCCSMGSYPACRDCPYHDDYVNRGCINKRNADIKDLINRQKAEVERYKGVIKLLEKDVATAKTEAIKEFVGRLKEIMAITYETVDGSRGYQTEDYFIDNLVKEMTVEKERDTYEMP